MNIRKIQCALCLLLLAAVLGGCGAQPKKKDLDASSRPSVNTGPLIPTTNPADQPTTEATVPPDEAPSPVHLEPVTRLSTIKWRTVPQLLSLGNGNVLACRNYFVEGKGIIGFLDIVNVVKDQVLYQTQTTSALELLNQQFPDGSFILKDPKSNTFYVYDQTLQITDQFSAPNTDGYFSYNRKNYYFVNNNILYQMDVGTGNYARMALQYDMRLQSLISVHPDRDIVVAKFYLSFYNENTGVCAIDCKTGKYLLLKDTVSHFWFDGDTFYAAVTNDAVYGSDIYYGSLSGGMMQKASTSLLGSDTVSYSMLPGSGILMHRTVDENNLSTTVYDLAGGGISCKLAQYGYQTSTLGAIYLQQEQLIFGVYPDEYDFSPVVIDPKALTYEKSLSLNKASWPSLVDRTIILNYEQEVKGPALPENLQALRQQADGLEEKYGISILMENQTLGLCNSYASAEADSGAIGNALTVLDQALSLYPEGFLKQFQNGIGEGGLYFCLVGRIQGSMDPVGMVNKNCGRYEVALDITASNLDRTVHHELWHAIEMRLSTDSFDHPQWQAANPQGFLYYGHYDSGYRQLTQWTYASSGNQCYFVDAYSQINAREDRARLMEYVMVTDASDLLQSSALRNKLNMMSKTIRNHFDTTGWQTPYWERYL